MGIIMFKIFIWESILLYIIIWLEIMFYSLTSGKESQKYLSIIDFLYFLKTENCFFLYTVCIGLKFTMCIE